MKTYSDEIIKALQADQTTTEVDGLTIRVKAMPDEPRPGMLEPREVALMMQQPVSDTARVAEGMPPTLEGMRQMMGFPNRNLNTVEIHTRYEEHTFRGNLVKLWVYYPRKPEGKKGRPCLIFFHGGGWIGGSTFTVENPCKLLAELADCVVVNVDYSLAPEKPYPNGFNDCYETIRHVYEHADDYGIDAGKIAIAGDSAGGNLSAACSLRDRDEGAGRIRLQVLIYPAVTFASETPGYTFDIGAYELDDSVKPMVMPMLMGMSATTADSPIGHMYLPDTDLAETAYVSPLLAKSFANVAPAMIVTPEFDGLRLQGEAYGRALMKAGVPVEVFRYKGQMHAFIDKLGIIPQAEDLVMEMAARVKAL